MKKERQKRRQFVRSGFVVLLALVLALSPLTALGMPAEAVEGHQAEVEALQEWQPEMYQVTFIDFDGIILYQFYMQALIPNHFFRDLPTMREEGFVGWCWVGDGSALLNYHDAYTLWHPVTLTAIWESHIVRHQVHIEACYRSRAFNVSHGQPIGWENMRVIVKVCEYYGHYYLASNFVLYCNYYGKPALFLPHHEAAMWVVDGPMVLRAFLDREELMHFMQSHGLCPMQLMRPVNFSFNGGSDHSGATWRNMHILGNSPTVWNSLTTLQDSIYRQGYDFVGWCQRGDGSDLVDLWQIVDLALAAEWPQSFVAIWEPTGNAPCADTNLARSATMSASSALGVRTADRANNGIREGAVTNSWSAAGIGQEWLMVDFGEQVNFNHIRIFQGGNRITGYRFEYSNDGVNWTSFHSGNRIMEATPAHYTVTTPTPLQAQFIRLFSESSVGVTPIVVFEFEVYFMP